MSNPKIWHFERKRSWWDGSAIAWCGVRFESGTYASDLWFIPAGGKNCPACEAARKRNK